MLVKYVKAFIWIAAAVTLVIIVLGSLIVPTWVMLIVNPPFGIIYVWTDHSGWVKAIQLEKRRFRSGSGVPLVRRSFYTLGFGSYGIVIVESRSSTERITNPENNNHNVRRKRCGSHIPFGQIIMVKNKQFPSPKFGRMDRKRVLIFF